MDLEALRNRWIKEQSSYEEFAQQVRDRLQSLIQDSGTYVYMSCRVKDVESLVKKAIIKDYTNPYEEIGDKAGVRAVVRYSSDVDNVCELVRNNFNVKKEDRKLDDLSPETFGYLGVHFDIISDDDTRPASCNEDIPCEVQVHTLCQNVWAEHSHFLAYKATVEIPKHIRRILHRASALLEATDEGFESSRQQLVQVPGYTGAIVLWEWEKVFFRCTGALYNSELSLRMVEALLPSYYGDSQSAVKNVAEFGSKRFEALRTIFDQYREVNSRSAFLYQPESIAIFERLEHDRYLLEKIWEQANLPVRELNRMAEIWGLKIDEDRTE